MHISCRTVKIQKMPAIDNMFQLFYFQYVYDQYINFHISPGNL